MQGVFPYKLAVKEGEKTMLEALQSINWSPLWISVKTAILATILSFIVGILIARFVMFRREKTKWVLDGIFTLPLVLPPTVAGFLLLILFSPVRPFGMFLEDTFGIRIVGEWAGCVIAAVVVSFPLMYRNARSAFEQVDINLLHAGRTLGMKESTIFRKVILPAAGPGIASGTVLTFARALGEYGATMMLAGSILGKTRTISTAISTEVAANRYDTAGIWTTVIILISFAAVFGINLVTGRGMKTIRRWR